MVRFSSVACFSLLKIITAVCAALRSVTSRSIALPAKAGVSGKHDEKSRDKQQRSKYGKTRRRTLKGSAPFSPIKRWAADWERIFRRSYWATQILPPLIFFPPLLVLWVAQVVPLLPLRFGIIATTPSSPQLRKMARQKEISAVLLSILWIAVEPHYDAAGTSTFAPLNHRPVGKAIGISVWLEYPKEQRRKEPDGWRAGSVRRPVASWIRWPSTGTRCCQPWDLGSLGLGVT